MKHYNLKQVALSQRLGVSKGYISMLVKEKEPLTINLVNAILKSFPILNLRWLLTGEGEMFFREKEVPPGTLEGMVMEGDSVYEAKREGILESVLRGLAEVEDEVRVLRAEVTELKGDKGDKGDKGGT